MCHLFDLNKELRNSFPCLFLLSAIKTMLTEFDYPFQHQFVFNLMSSTTYYIRKGQSVE